MHLPFHMGTRQHMSPLFATGRLSRPDLHNADEIGPQNSRTRDAQTSRSCHSEPFDRFRINSAKNLPERPVVALRVTLLLDLSAVV